MALERFLTDTSVWARVGAPRVREVMDRLAGRGLIATCGVIDLEVLYSARSASDHARALRHHRSLGQLPMPDGLWWRAVEVQGLLARRGHHRAASIPDLLIAATAEHHGAVVLHYDADFDLIAAVTGQPARWVARGGA